MVDHTVLLQWTIDLGLSQYLAEFLATFRSHGGTISRIACKLPDCGDVSKHFANYQDLLFIEPCQVRTSFIACIQDAQILYFKWQMFWEATYYSTCVVLPHGRETVQHCSICQYLTYGNINCSVYTVNIWTTPSACHLSLVPRLFWNRKMNLGTRLPRPNK